MAESFVEPGEIRGYHAHIYYNAATRPVAERLRGAIGNRFEAELGRWHDEAVGPHPAPMYQVAFPVGEFPRQRKMPPINPLVLPGRCIPVLPGKFGHAVRQGDR